MSNLINQIICNKFLSEKVAPNLIHDLFILVVKSLVKKQTKIDGLKVDAVNDIFWLFMNQQNIMYQICMLKMTLCK